MVRYIKSIEFGKDKITIHDNVESWDIDGDIKDFIKPELFQRWYGYIDRVKKEYEAREQK